MALDRLLEALNVLISLYSAALLLPGAIIPSSGKGLATPTTNDWLDPPMMILKDGSACFTGAKLPEHQGLGSSRAINFYRESLAQANKVLDTCLTGLNQQLKNAAA